jgi:uncharacterized membrane protein YgcG
MKKILKYNKKAQIGETLTWVVATLIIVLILALFIISSVALGKVKNIASSRKVDTGNSEMDLIKTKTEIAYTLNNQNKNKIEEWIALEEGGNEDFDGFGGGESGGGGAGGEY